MIEQQKLPEKNSNPSIQHLLAETILKRAEHGKEIYGTYLQRFNGRNSLHDLLEEDMDRLVYFMQLQEESLVIKQRLVELLDNLKKEDISCYYTDELQDIIDKAKFLG